MNKGLVIVIAVMIVLFGIIWFSIPSEDSSTSTNTNENTNTDNEVENVEVIQQEETPPTPEEPIVESVAAWRQISLTNVHDDSTYTIDSLSDKPVIIESFAVWCPTCTKQQRELKELHADQEFGESFHSIGLDTDQNEDAAKVLSHAQKNGFNWRYSVSPVSLTNALVDEFGISVVNAPSAPVILVCQDGGDAYFLEKGVKKAHEIKQEIQTKCGV